MVCCVYSLESPHQPLLYRRSRILPRIIVICFLTWHHCLISVARTTHVSNKFPWSQWCSRNWNSTVGVTQEPPWNNYWGGLSWPRVYLTFFVRSSTENEIFSADKYENANNSWHFHIYKPRNFHTQLCLARKNLQLSAIRDLLAWQISFSAELSTKNVLQPRGLVCLNRNLTII